ncbi:hypothetical protein WEN_01575 [Mycoplasma wenyonii str. Massachusetts]|uniref:Uncharacterized protein n=1 Tax=Mycoplasma wenyonii (strain Massachusetts) TaxID=1197325 RepID=I6ZIT3_MYCWM|nr:hypothetical protein [Mycoplasma wenyonii]AFN65110.1 hypothetical protein WEN_01575 [Mycoplasma wenyonii str. Massachusetts]
MGDRQFSKETDTQSRNGLTPKKFLLMGVNVNTKDVEVTGLVSLVKDKHRGIKAKCTDDHGPTTIQNGYCDDKVFFKEFESLENQPGLIETELKNKEDKRVAVLGFERGLTLTATFGKRQINDGKNVTKLSRSAPIKVWNSKTSKHENLYTGKPRSDNRPYVVVHDFMFMNGTLKSKWEEMANKGKNFKSLIELGATNQGKESKVPLNKNRQYYLWDPSYTEIKEGTLKTKEGHKLPWNVSFSLPYTISLIK